MAESEASPKTDDQRPDDDAEIARLVTLSPLAYEREREATAKRLGVRVAALDRNVEAARAKQCDRSEQAPALILPALEPWPGPVDGAALLTRITAALQAHVVMESGGAEAVALWTLHTHAFDVFAYSPRLAITSAEKRCGKTTLLDVLGCLAPRPLQTANATAPAVFRTIELLTPTLLIDEADTFLKRNDELRGVLNSGHRRATASVLRLVGDEHEPRTFRTWAPTAIAMIGNLPDTLADRSIEIRLRRRLPNEPLTRFRADRATDLAQLARMAARWAADHSEALRRSDPSIPLGLHDRAADNWGPLFAIADEAGEGWPERVRQIAVAMAARDEDGGSVGELLLADIRQTFDEIERGMIQVPYGPHFRIGDTDRIRSLNLANILAAKEGHPGRNGA
jgi:putative DNA primase/helicase